MNVEQIKRGADQRGLTVGESVTDERLARVDHSLMEGHAVRSAADATRAGFDWDDSWGADAFAVPYRIGEVGCSVIAPPKVHHDLALVVLPEYRVVAHVSGLGQRQSDVDEVGEACDMVWTVLAA